MQHGERAVKARHSLDRIALQAAILALDQGLDRDQRVGADIGLHQVDAVDGVLQRLFTGGAVAGAKQGHGGRPVAFGFEQGQGQTVLVDHVHGGVRRLGRRCGLVELVDDRGVEQRRVFDVADAQGLQGVGPAALVDEVERFVGRQLAHQVGVGLVAPGALGQQVFAVEEVAARRILQADIAVGEAGFEQEVGADIVAGRLGQAAEARVQGLRGFVEGPLAVKVDTLGERHARVEAAVGGLDRGHGGGLGRRRLRQGRAVKRRIVGLVAVGDLRCHARQGLQRGFERARDAEGTIGDIDDAVVAESGFDDLDAEVAVIALARRNGAQPLDLDVLGGAARTVVARLGILGIDGEDDALDTAGDRATTGDGIGQVIAADMGIVPGPLGCAGIAVTVLAELQRIERRGGLRVGRDAGQAKSQRGGKGEQFGGGLDH